MNPVRGIVMLLAAAIAFYRGWQLHTGRYAWLAYGLGVLALILGLWHFYRLSTNPRERR
jgi:hypothetical protein